MYNKIKSLCEQNNLSITELEKKLGFGNGTIHSWKNSSPSIDKLKKVANYFNVSVDCLIGNNEILSKDTFDFAWQYEKLPNEKKDLVKCYISIINTEKVM